MSSVTADYALNGVSKAAVRPQTLSKNPLREVAKLPQPLWRSSYRLTDLQMQAFPIAMCSARAVSGSAETISFVLKRPAAGPAFILPKE